LSAARRLVAEFQEATTSAAARELLRHAMALAEGEDCYQALKLARRVMRHEEEVLGLAPMPPARAETTVAS
jgi:flagellar protein FlbT